MSLPLSALPRCVALRSKQDKSYLRSVHDESLGGSLVELGHGEGGIMDPRARFYLEASKEHEGLVHVRCCYNNKYWVPQQRVLDRGSAPRWVVGTADEAEEDLSKPSCTLLQHIAVPGEDGSTWSRFLHSKLGKYACGSSSSPVTSIRSYLHIASHEEADSQDDDGLIDAFTMIDVSERKQLPSYLAFKGDNGSFLVADDDKYLVFSGEDIGDPRALHTILTDDGGDVRIKSNYFGLLWRHNDVVFFPSGTEENFILADSSTTEPGDIDVDQIFSVTTGDDFIALRSSNNKFCKRLTAAAYTGRLSAEADSITTEARLQCYEPVVSRGIYDVDYRLGEARIHTNGIDGLYSQTVKNQTSTTNKTTLTFTYSSTVETTWSSSVSVKLGVTTTLETGISFVAEGKIEISAEFSGSYTWGETKTEQKQTTKEITVDVPPMKKVTVKAIGSNGVCDIPFSYKQRDVLLNGEEVIQEFTDGMYFGVKTSDITFDVIEEDL